MSHISDSISERNFDANRPPSTQQSTSQPFRYKNSVNNRMHNHQASQKHMAKKMPRRKQCQGEASFSSHALTSCPVNIATTACQNLSIDGKQDAVNQGDNPRGKNAKKKDKRLKQLQMPTSQFDFMGLPQTSHATPSFSGHSEYMSVQEFFGKQINPIYPVANPRYYENLSYHPQYQLAQTNQMVIDYSARFATSVPNTPQLQQPHTPKSKSIPNSPMLPPEYNISQKCMQNVMLHPLLSQSYHPQFSNQPIQFNNHMGPQETTNVSDKKDATGTPKHKKNRKKSKSTTDLKFDDYLPADVVEAGLKDNIFIEGVIRINPKQFQHSYVSSCSDRSEQDILIDGIKHRNRALEGDIVVVELIEIEPEEESEKNIEGDKQKEDIQQKDVQKKNMPKEVEQKEDVQKEDVQIEDVQKENMQNQYVQNENMQKQVVQNENMQKEDVLKKDVQKEDIQIEDIQKRGKVVFIKEKVHSRTCIGNLKPMADNNRQKALFIPRDHRIPRLNIPFTSWPDNFFTDYKNYENTLFLARIDDWVDTRFAMGTILSNIGQSGDMVSETMAILAQTGLDIKPFGPEYRHLYPRLDYTIPDEELSIREDCRKLCLFSIDPSNCRDIDDAVSCRELENGNYEIGVHIADVSHFLTENTMLDAKVAEKATTIYLVEKAYHMLPDDLCMLCSLFPGVDKLAFSVFWEITKDAEVLSHRFAKTVINSCAQLSYDHAQSILEDDQDAETNFPEIYNSFVFQDLHKVIKKLGNIAAILRKTRFDGGALKIDQPKLSFRLNTTDGLPESFCIYQSKESHQLIEEFMLLANMTVAARIKEDHPKLAFLRCHPPPSGFMLKQLAKALKPMGIELDISSAGSLYRSLVPHVGPDSTDMGKVMVLNMLCAKPMTRAKYFCADRCHDDDFLHYALNTPLYTHFTSPIRRYADIMVHRLLAASIKVRETPKWEVDKVRMIAAQCNKQKYNAKKAYEMSSELYTLKYIEMHSPLATEAAVVEVREKYIDVIIIAMGLNRRIFFNNDFPGKYLCVKHEGGTKLSKMHLTWNAVGKLPEFSQEIQVFSILKVEMYKDDELGRIDTKLVRPQCTNS